MSVTDPTTDFVDDVRHSREDLAELELHHIIDELGADERELLLELAGRLLHGQRLYGKFDLDSDPRDFLREAEEEDADWLVYRAAHLIRQRKKRG